MTSVPAHKRAAPDIRIETRGIQTRVWIQGAEVEGLTYVAFLAERPGDLPELKVTVIPAGGDRELAAAEAPPAMALPVREAARRRTPLDGADAQALEGALTQAEREVKELRRAYEAERALFLETAAHRDQVTQERDALRKVSEAVERHPRRLDASRRCVFCASYYQETHALDCPVGLARESLSPVPAGAKVPACPVASPTGLPCLFAKGHDGDHANSGIGWQWPAPATEKASK